MDTREGRVPANRSRHHVAAEVRAWRGRLDMTQAQLAELLGISQAQMSQRLSSKVAFTLDELDVLAERFGISTAELLPAHGPRGRVMTDWRSRRLRIVPAPDGQLDRSADSSPNLGRAA